MVYRYDKPRRVLVDHGKNLAKPKSGAPGRRPFQDRQRFRLGNVLATFYDFEQPFCQRATSGNFSDN